jgi:hypothetical protein
MNDENPPCAISKMEHQIDATLHQEEWQTLCEAQEESSRNREAEEVSMKYQMPDLPIPFPQVGHTLVRKEQNCKYTQVRLIRIPPSKYTHVPLIRVRLPRQREFAKQHQLYRLVKRLPFQALEMDIDEQSCRLWLKCTCIVNDVRMAAYVSH